MKLHFTIIIAIIALFCPHLNGQSTGSIDALKSDDLAQRKAEIDNLKEQRAQSIENMIAILDGNFPADIKDSVAIALGDCRASEAVDALIKNMNLDVRPRIIKGLLSDEEINPVSTSLEKIGNPSIPVIIKFLGEKGSFLDSPRTEEGARSVEASVLLLRALCRIDGEKGIVRIRLQEALDRETDPQKQARLESALKALDREPFAN